jgi:hypothetical protein
MAHNDAVAALPAFRSALDLWRGDPLMDLVDWPSATPIRTRLEELHRSAREEAAPDDARPGPAAAVCFCDPMSPGQRGSNGTPPDCSASTSPKAPPS